MPSNPARPIPIEKRLRDHRQFRLLPDEVIGKIAAEASFKNLHKGQLLFGKGDIADALYIVIEGNIAIELLSHSGKIIRVSTIGKGLVLGELGVLDKGVRTADARAIVDSILIELAGRILGIL